MIQSKLLVSSQDYYSCELTQKIPVRVSIVTINGPEGFGILESLNGDENTLKKYVSQLKNSKNIIEVNITYQSANVYWTRVIHKLDHPSIYDTVLESGSMTLLPIIIEKGIQIHTVLSPTSEALKQVLEKLRTRFTTVNVKWLSSGSMNSSQMLLTPKQLEAFKLAYKTGYYDIPRRSNVIQLAKQLGIKRVALQERLRRAELRIMTEFAAKLL
ncbi:MAG: helix-turn-helix domain-containing protein [Candidatus Hodarchaeota archaeon]